MRITIATICFSLLPIGAFAQSASSQCNRAWLASDWATVAIECGVVADSDTAEAKKYGDDVAALGKLGAPQQMQSTGLEIGIYDLGMAGIYRAKAAVGYYKLQKPALYGAARESAIQALSSAISISQQIGSQTNPLFVEALSVVRASDFPRQAINANAFNLP